MSGPTTHSALGASSAERWFNCPASARIAANLPKQPDSVWSREGTRAHALAQHCLEGKKRKSKPFIGKPVPGLTDDLTPVTEDMADAVQVYLDAVWACVDADPEDAMLLVEVKFKLPFIGKDLDGSVPGGTNDASVYFVKRRALYTFDYKHGAGKFVSVKNNKQTLYYMTGANEWLKAQGHSPQTFYMSIVQPRCDYSEEKVRTQAVTLAELQDFREALQVAAYKARKPDAKCNPGPWCKGSWCPGALQTACEAFVYAATNGLIVSPSPKGSNIFGAVDLTPTTIDPTRLNPDELGKRLVQAEMLKDYLSCLEDFAISEAKAGRMPAGHGWFEGQTKRIWSKPEAEVLKELQSRGNGREWAPRKIMSVAEVEKEIGKATFKKDDKLQAMVGKTKPKAVLDMTDCGKTPYTGPIGD